MAVWEDQIPEVIMKRLFSALILLFSLSITPAFADLYDEADKAYEAGDYKKTKSILLPLAEGGNADAMNLIGVMYKNGYGFSKNIKLACDWFEKSALLGEKIAQSNLSACYHSGNGRVKNDDLTVYWAAKSAMQGDVTAQINLLIFYHDKDKSEAQKWGQMAIDSGNRAVRAAMWAYDIDYVGPPPSSIDKICALVMVGIFKKPFEYCD